MEIIITSVGQNRLEAIRAIRQFTGANLKAAKDLIELAEKNYTVAISNVPQENAAEVMGAFSSVGVRTEIAGSAVSIFRKIPFNPSKNEIHLEQPTEIVRPYQPSSFAVSKKTDGSLKGYLKAVATLECQMWNQDRLIRGLGQKEASLAHSKKIDKPEIEHFYVIDEAVGGLGSGVVALFLSVLLFVNILKYGILWALLGLVISWLIITLVLSFLFTTLENFLASPSYRRAMKKYDAYVAADQKRIQQETKLKQELQQQIRSVQAERQRTKRSLDALYALSIIHTNYRNLVAVSSFYDYFDKGICTRLEGRDGAYAFFEEALRFQRIESKLDIIIEKLDEIAENQQYLASLIREGNAALSRIEQQNNRMIKQLNAINENTAITEYNTRCSAESLSVMESISIYRFLTN